MLFPCDSQSRRQPKTAVTDSGVKAFEKARPRCEVVR
jgi:hypothetical protein